MPAAGRTLHSSVCWPRRLLPALGRGRSLTGSRFPFGLMLNSSLSSDINKH